MQIVYLKLDRHVQLRSPQVKVRDLGAVFCSDGEFGEKILETTLWTFHSEQQGEKKTASVMAVIAAVHAQFAAEDFYIQNVGESEFAMDLSFEKHQKEAGVWYKVVPVMLVTFFGSLFAIMTYNEDVGTAGVFEKIAGIMDVGQSGIDAMAVAYGLGIAMGLIVFFNHFGRKKLTKDPTPMEVEMEKYEADVEDTLIKETARKGESIDIS